jgi:hypothetical protein
MRPSRRSVGASTHALIYAFASADESAVTHARVAPYTNEANVHANMRACAHVRMGCLYAYAYAYAYASVR